MVDLHPGLEAIAGILAALLVVVGIFGALTGRPVRHAVDRLILAVVAAVAANVLMGLLLLVTGHVPTDPLHLLYAVAALAVLPIARFAVPSLPVARRRWVVIAGAVVLLGLLVRLLQTG